jgi:hypothetical protein
VLPWQYLVDPAVEDGLDGDFYAQLFGEFACEADWWILLAGLQTPAGEFPLAALVFEQHNVACFEQNAFDRNREGHRHHRSGCRGFPRRAYKTRRAKIGIDRHFRIPGPTNGLVWFLGIQACVWWRKRLQALVVHLDSAGLYRVEKL